jgi:hypothetical protein
MTQKRYIQTALIPFVPFSFFQELDVATCTPGVRPSIILAGLSRKPFLSWDSGQVPTDKCHETWAVIATFDSFEIFFHEFWTVRDLAHVNPPNGLIELSRSLEKLLSGVE